MKGSGPDIILVVPGLMDSGTVVPGPVGSLEVVSGSVGSGPIYIYTVLAGRSEQN